MAYGISIIIACFNSEKVIAQTLSYVKNQICVENIPWEVILINNNSTDQTVEIARNSWNLELLPNFRIIDEPKSGLAHARIKGYTESKFEIISFVDDDNLIPPNWVSYQYEIFKNPIIGILGATSIGKFDYKVPEWYEEHKLSFATGPLYDSDFIDITHDGLVYGAGMTLRKEIYTKLFENNWKPFLMGRIGATQSGGEDAELTLAARLLGYKIYYTNQIKTQHFILANRLTWERLEKMTAGFGQSDVFTLSYQIIFKERLGQGNWLTKMRRKWWFNYWAKKLISNKYRTQCFFSKNPESMARLLFLRSNSFCESIKINKFKFEESFIEANKLKPESKI